MSERIEQIREEIEALPGDTPARWLVYAERGAELLAAARLARRREARREAEERRLASLRRFNATCTRDAVTGRILHGAPPAA